MLVPIDSDHASIPRFLIVSVGHEAPRKPLASHVISPLATPPLSISFVPPFALTM